jgi:3-methyladenine DNA glycosylase AlkD
MSAASGPQPTAQSLRAEIAALPNRATPDLRAVRRRASAALKGATADEVRAIAWPLARDPGLRWIGYELIAFHPKAFASVTEGDLEALAQGLQSWGEIDAFGTILTGEAWRAGQASDALFARWAASPDRWLRRLALVSTTRLNPIGTRGDAARTLAICEALVADRDDMVVKGLSWALRVLSLRDRAAVEAFMARHGDRLAPRVRREVGSKLRTGLKTPRRT